MKKLFSTLWMALFLLGACGTAACADVLIPGEEIVKKTPDALPYILIGVAVIAAAVIIWRIRRKK